MKRFEDWPERLNAYIDTTRDVPFAYGVHDCATNALGAVEAITGIRLQDVPYHDDRSALQYLAEHSIESVVDLHLPRVSKSFAQRGDIVLVSIDGRDSLAVCLGSEAAAPGADGLLTVPMRLATVAWRV